MPASASNAIAAADASSSASLRACETGAGEATTS
jgi:hypothetical protein